MLQQQPCCMGPTLLERGRRAAAWGLLGKGAGRFVAVTHSLLPVQRRTLRLTCRLEVRTATLLPLEWRQQTHLWMS